MKIVLNEQQYQELEILIDIFDGMLFDGKEVVCFVSLKELIDQGSDIESLEEEKRMLIKEQLLESFEWLTSLNVDIKIKDILLKCIYQDNKI